MMKKAVTKYSDVISDRILTIRGQKVILDSDLAELYGVETKQLNRAVKRNFSRFPEDFAFQLTDDEYKSLRCHFGTLKKGQHRKYKPYVFTEHGAIMAANVLRSEKAVEMSVFVVRAFIRMREELVSQNDMEKRLDQIENILLVHDSQLQDLFDKIRPLLLPPPNPDKKKIGYHVKEKREDSHEKSQKVTKKERGANAAC